VLSGNKEVLVCMCNTNTEAACLNVTFTKFACKVKKGAAPVHRTYVCHHKNVLSVALVSQVVGGSILETP